MNNKRVYMNDAGCINPEHETRIRIFDTNLHKLIKDMLDEGFNDHEVVSWAVGTIATAAAEYRLFKGIEQRKARREKRENENG